jgi:heme exporter protein B
MLTLFYSEFILLWRRSYEWLYPLGFFIIILSLFPLAFSPSPLFLQKYFPGCVWISALFANLLSVQTIFLTDLEDGYLEQLLLSQTPLSFILLIKLTAHWMTTQIPLVFLTLLFGCLFHIACFTTFILCLSLLLGTPILTLIGSLSVALTLGLRQQGMLLSLLMLPLSIPVLIFGICITQQVQSGLSPLGPLAFLAGLLVLAITLLPLTLGATLRLSFDD